MDQTPMPADEWAVRVIEVKQSVFAANDRAADGLRECLRQRGTFLLNLVEQPGLGQDHHAAPHRRSARG